MKRETLLEQLYSNLKKAGILKAEVRLQPDPYGGWRVAAIASEFEHLSVGERRHITLGDLNWDEFSWTDFLTPDEVKAFGEPILDLQLEDIPSWPETLATANLGQTRERVFASDLEEDLPLPIVTTFYSLRGGVGRSTALAQTAKLLAKRGFSVLCIDMDLEAPGLAALFQKEDEVTPNLGVVSALIALEMKDKVDLRDHLIRLSDTEELYLLPAGIPSAGYAAQLRQLMPESWYREAHNPLHALLDNVRDLSIQPTFVLIDARTGIAPANAPLLFDISDIAIIHFFPHPQAYQGTEEIVRGLLASHTRRKHTPCLTPEPRFVISPLPPHAAEQFEREAREHIEKWLGWSASDIEEITHGIPYQERIAVSRSIADEASNWYAPIADWLERFAPTPSENQAQPPQTERARILAELEFGAGVAEDLTNLDRSFLQTESFAKALQPKISLVIGRKGVGKTALFRHIVEHKDPSAIPLQCPAKFISRSPWVLSAEGLREVGQMVQVDEVGWRTFWTVYTALVVAMHFPQIERPAEFQSLPAKETLTENSWIALLETVLKTPRIGIIARDFLREVDKDLPKDVLLIADGLDTGFGGSDADRKRRKLALEGLFDFTLGIADAFQKLRFKILLREDIWRTLRFENKTHLSGRSVTLDWTQKTDYYKVVLKQASLQPDLKALFDRVASSRPVEEWDEGDVFRAWNLLVGERMRGGKAAFTVNWVWNRLADGNGNHTPRHLLNFFALAIEKERKTQGNATAYIRPTHLKEALPEVSGQAVQSLEEEFGELAGLLQELTNIGRSPVEAENLSAFREEVGLAREIGLLSPYEVAPNGSIPRWRVPELYQFGLNMTRKGEV